RVGLAVEGGGAAEQEDRVDVVAARRQAAAEDARDLLRAGGFGLGLHQHHAPSSRSCAGRDRAVACGGHQAVGPHGLLRHGVSSLNWAMRVDASAKPSDGSIPTSRRHAMVSAAAMRTVEMLHASAAPIRPKVGPRTAMSRKRTTRADATMRG